jgi:hypothetical protein
MRPKMKKPLKNQGFVSIVLPGFASGCRMGDFHSIINENGK